MPSASTANQIIRVPEVAVSSSPEIIFQTTNVTISRPIGPQCPSGSPCIGAVCGEPVCPCKMVAEGRKRSQNWMDFYSPEGQAKVAATITASWAYWAKQQVAERRRNGPSQNGA